MNQNRESAGCAVSYDGEEVYIFGGYDLTGSATHGSDTIDRYIASSNSWTDSGNDELPQLAKDLKCITNLYDETIICPGGYASSDAYSDTIIYKTPIRETIQIISLNISVASYGLSKYEFINDGTDQAFILFVSGGQDGDLNAIDTIQYIVAYNSPSLSPTSAPSPIPTISPTNAPSESPTIAPTHSPTIPPSMAPTIHFESTVPETTTPVTKVGTVGPKTTAEIGMDSDNASQLKLYSLYLLIMFYGYAM